MKERVAELLKLVVEQYIETAQPIGSKFLVEAGELDVSGATIRNELKDLEDAGYLTHPHTSAGRVPTEQGYRYYIDHIMVPSDASVQTKQSMDGVLDTTSSDDVIKTIGKIVSAEIHNAVIVAFHPSRVYYTGISYLFSQPEFHDAQMTVTVSSIFDHCEEQIDAVYDAVPNGEVRILLGKENPLGRLCGMVAVRAGDMLFSVLGPMRMDYKKTYGLVDFIARETLI